VSRNIRPRDHYPIKKFLLKHITSPEYSKFFLGLTLDESMLAYKGIRQVSMPNKTKSSNK